MMVRIPIDGFARFDFETQAVQQTVRFLKMAAERVPILRNNMYDGEAYRRVVTLSRMRSSILRNTPGRHTFKLTEM